jgi:hypothetical protein
VAQIVWYGSVRTQFTVDCAEERLRAADIRLKPAAPRQRHALSCR